MLTDYAAAAMLTVHRSSSAGEVRVGKSYLVNRLEVLFEQERIELPAARPETEALLLELKAFERHRTERAHLIFG